METTQVCDDKFLHDESKYVDCMYKTDENN